MFAICEPSVMLEFYVLSCVLRRSILQDYLEEERKYADSMFQIQDTLASVMYEEMVARDPTGYGETPTRHGAYEYYSISGDAV